MFTSLRRKLRRALETINRHIPLFISVFIAGFALGFWFRPTKSVETPAKTPAPGRGIGKVLYGKYGNIPNGELEKKTLEIVAAIRAAIKSNREEEIQSRYDCDKQLASASTKDVAASIRKKCDEQLDLAVTRLISDYEEKYKAEVVVLREQLVQRVSGSAEKQAPILYWYPTNPLGLEQVASGLEILAKQLPKAAGTP